MNGSIIRYILGYVLKLEAIFLILPCIVAIIYGEREGFSYLFTAVLCAVIGFLMSHRKPANQIFYLKEGCMATALSWIIMSVFGGLPFWLTGEIPSFVDTLFETVSGFTTTGASILSDVEALSHCSLFWRSFTHWIGGMGVLVFLLAIIPLSGGSHINLMRAESPGPTVGKLVPKLRQTARILYIIYISMTIIQIILLLCSKMPLFDSLTITFGTAGTGGFGIKNSSIADYTACQQWIITIFMILFGVNFNAYYFLLFKQAGKAFRMEEVRCYLIIIGAASAIIAVNIYNSTMGVAETIRDAVFQVASIITTTGFATTDFNLWPTTSKTILVMLMFIGACAGSTGGGIKVSRFIILAKSAFREIKAYIHPNIVRRIKLEGKTVETDTLKAVHVFFITFFLLFAISIFALSFNGYDLITNFTAVATTMNNIGPGLELVGPTQNFSLFSPFSKIVLIVDMLAGRLELFPLLILFHPAVWRDISIHRIRHHHIHS